MSGQESRETKFERDSLKVPILSVKNKRLLLAWNCLRQILSNVSCRTVHPDRAREKNFTAGCCCPLTKDMPDSTGYELYTGGSICIAIMANS